MGQMEDLEAENEALRKRLSHYQLGVKAGGIALWRWCARTNKVWLAPEWEELTGFPLDEFGETPESVEEMVHPDDRARVNAAMEDHMSGGTPFDLQYRVRHRERGYVWVRGRARLETDDSGAPLGLSGASRDVTEWRAAREAQRLSEERVHRLVEVSPVAMVVVSATTQEIMLRNRKFEDLFGYTAEEVPNVPRWWPLAYPDPDYSQKIQDAWAERLEEAARGDHHLKPIEATVQCKDGSKKRIEFEATLLEGDYLVLFIDRTEEREIQRAFLAACGGVHDHICSPLTGLSLLLEALRIQVERGDLSPGELLAKVEDIIANLEKAKADARRLAKGQTIEGGSDFQLLSSTQELLEEHRKNHPRFTFWLEESPTGHLPSAVAFQLYVIILEAVHNAIIHSGGTEIRVYLEDDPPGFQIRICDNGTQSFREITRGLGIRTMGYRAKIIGGNLTIQNGTEPTMGGIEVICHIPLLED